MQVNPVLMVLAFVVLVLSTAANGVAAYKLTSMHTKIEDIFCIEQPTN